MSSKLRAIGSFLSYFVLSYPARLGRFFFFYRSMNAWRRPWSFLEWILLFIDLTGIPEMYQILHEILNWRLRGLNERELEMARRIFGQRLNYSCIRVNGHNTIVCKRMHIAFVSFHTVHFHDGISDAVLIHELVHVWQYERFGSAYIVRALHAQRTKEGYDYGGKATLAYKKMLLEYNFEQMAEIIMHGFQHADCDPVYDNFIAQLQE